VLATAWCLSALLTPITAHQSHPCVWQIHYLTWVYHGFPGEKSALPS
jgi:hypothetical protein